MRQSLIITCLLLAGAWSLAGEETTKAPVEWAEEISACAAGLYPQPGGEFGVLLFCEDALGTYLAVVHTGPLGAPASGPWRLNDRVWYEDRWGADVTGYRWSKDGKLLFITTSDVYGSGGVFALDLKARTASQLLPTGRPVTTEKPGPGFVLNQLKQE
jgi:hypothetical protein